MMSPSISPVPEHVWPLLDRYFAGTYTSAEREEAEAALASYPQLGAFAQAFAEQVDPAGETSDRAASWAAIHQRIEETANGAKHRSWTAWASHRYARIAAGTVIGGILVVSALREATRIVPRFRANPSAARVYATRGRESAAFTLIDGTHVILAPQTTLRLRPGFGGDTRAISLTGQAHFVVTRSAGTPFVVYTGRTSTKVLGTTFDVRRYADETRTQISVTAGKVAIAPRARRSLVITAGYHAECDDSTVVTTSLDNTTQSVDWHTRRIVFHGATVSDVLTTMTHWYGYQFQLADSSLARRNLSAVFDYESPREALATLKLLLDVDLAFHGNVITMQPRHNTLVIPHGRNMLHDSLVPSTTGVGR